MPKKKVSRTASATRRTPKKLSVKKKKKHLNQRVILGILLIILGLNLCGLAVFYYIHQQTVLSFKVAPNSSSQSERRLALPTQLLFPNLNQSFEVEPASITDGSWQTSEQHPNYLLQSARPGEGSNVVIYGHNRKHIFADLKKLRIGDTVTLTTKNNATYHYRVKEITIVNPDQVEVIQPSTQEMLTLYTCTGFLDTKRLVVFAFPEKIDLSDVEYLTPSVELPQ